jgi:hypothetical protein
MPWPNDEEWVPIFREGNEIIGSISTVWGEIEHYVYLFFETILGVPQERAWPVFHSQRNFRSRFDMLTALAQVTWHADPRLPRLLSLLGRVRVFAERRNYIEHGAWQQVESMKTGKYLLRATPTQYANESLRLRFGGIGVDPKRVEKYLYDFKKLLRTRGHMEKLRDDLGDMWRHATWPDKYELPPRG